MKLIAAVLALFAYLMLTAWAFMVTVGVIRAEWVPDLPTIGYGPSILVVGLLTVIAALMRGSSSASD
ncbi:hypothetical protein [Micromonospora okii]|uniref:hypothetical protein n=1 Tax=Micromonospora okii TaxID=1182970 RepID=UPI001E4EFEBC|nr:hypothetical protein [Micromonospora okii]